MSDDQELDGGFREYDGIDPEEYDDDGNPYPECGWSPGQGCSLAGSEECDFECPNRAEMIAELKHIARLGREKEIGK